MKPYEASKFRGQIAEQIIQGLVKYIALTTWHPGKHRLRKPQQN